MEKITLAKALPVIILLVLAFFTVRDLLIPGLPPTHDGEYHIIRFYEFDKSLQSGQWYPRWAPDLNKGYGIPLFNYVYPLPNYIASILHLFSMSFIDSFKLNMIIASFVGAVFMYLWAKQFFKAWGGVIASIFYTYSPYHLLDIYIRGSVGEVWALALFPAFLWSITKFLREQKILFIPISAVFLSLIIFSHNILALMFLPFAFFYTAFIVLGGKGDKGSGVGGLVIYLLGVGLSAIFWLPALLEKGYVRGLEIFDYREHFVEIYQLIFPSWGSGFSADLSTQGLSFQIGIANLAALVFAIVLAAIFRKKYTEEVAIIIFIIISTFAAIFLMLSVSLPIWKNIPFIQYFQFPWRFLSLVILFLSFLAGSVVYFWKSKVIIILLAILAAGFGLGYANSSYYHLRDDNYYISRSNFIDGTNSPGNAFNTTWFNTNLNKATSFTSERGDDLQINIAYFPGWQVFVDGKKVKVEVSEDGLIQIEKPNSRVKIEAKLLDTPIRRAANIISLLSFLAVSVLLLMSWRARMIKKV